METVKTLKATIGRKQLLDFIERERFSHPVVYALHYDTKSSTWGLPFEVRNHHPAEAQVLLMILPDDEVKVVAKIEPNGSRNCYLSWMGDMEALTRILSAPTSGSGAANALKTYIKRTVFSNVWEGFGYDGIVQAFRSLGVDNIYRYLLV